ncbi:MULTISPECIES: ABC transporter substrate-binding protein [unclassified Duganella]|uniref:ABC transporter substrate-binding protein n=1 Tax=unclassified Duganella TaxID=2636909 RepID=UPI00088646DC|nr:MULTISPECIES: ABC transporter substrate-binding protein [unclassified Duganella]SDH28991.1 peptide/nickel transport system substrate-binding protein [Duganella sp. OV458]SDK37940.1 peptide/nickel transport system substrate-binding protein [Duganella sp. OV510]
MLRWRRWFSAVVLSASAVLATAAAADLRIGFKAEVTSADPHVLNGQNRNVWLHVYESLAHHDSQLRPTPGLALSWRVIDPTTWEFQLRPGVRFHNGETMTAADVEYSLRRAMAVKGARTFRTYLKGIVAVEATGPLTVQVRTSGPSPAVPDNLGLIAILPKSLGAVDEASFADGRSAIGTGPYKFGSWTHGQRVVLLRNADYWGDKEPWNKVTFEFIPREPARASALLSGSVDLIDGATANLAYSLKRSQKVVLQSVTSYMLNYIGLDQFRAASPYLRANDGTPLPHNPLRDLRVRQALMLAISREDIVRYLMKSDATAAAQIVPAGFVGYDADLKAPQQNIAAARDLLTQAGYPQGFRITLHCPNNRYVNDARMCEALAQQLAHIRIQVELSAMPFSVYQTRVVGTGGASDFSMFLIGYGSVTGDAMTGLVSVIRSRDNKAGVGANNYGGYSNLQVDALVDQATHTFDLEQRQALLRQAASLAMQDGAIIPLVHLNATWALRKGLTIQPRADGFTMATDVRMTP